MTTMTMPTTPTTEAPALKPPKFCMRAVEWRPLERADGEADDGFTLEGYAAVFNSPTRIDSWEGEFDEVIKRGAFKRTLNARTPVLQFDHGHDFRTGTVPIGSIEETREDEHGLFVRARLFDNPVVEPIRQAIAGGAIDGMSFRFRVLKEEIDTSGDVDLRTITEVELFELGPVVFPAYDATSVGVRTLLARLDESERSTLLDELRDVVCACERDDEPPTPPEPVQVDTSDDNADPAARHSAPPNPQAAWYLPGREDDPSWSV